MTVFKIMWPYKGMLHGPQPDQLPQHEYYTRYHNKYKREFFTDRQRSVDYKVNLQNLSV